MTAVVQAKVSVPAMAQPASSSSHCSGSEVGAPSVV